MVLAVAACFNGRRHVVTTVRGDYTALRVARGGWHRHNGDVEATLSKGGEGAPEVVALNLVVLVGAEDGQVLVVEGCLLERRQKSVGLDAC